MAFCSFLEEYAHEYIVGWKLDRVRQQQLGAHISPAFNAFNATFYVSQATGSGSFYPNC